MGPKAHAEFCLHIPRHWEPLEDFEQKSLLVSLRASPGCCQGLLSDECGKGAPKGTLAVSKLGCRGCSVITLGSVCYRLGWHSHGKTEPQKGPVTSLGSGVGEKERMLVRYWGVAVK